MPPRLEVAPRAVAGRAPVPRFGPRIADWSSTRAQVRNFLEGLLWIALATFIVWYGNGRESLVAVVQDAEQVYARYLVAWAVGVCINTAIFLYIAVFLPLVRGDKREWEQTAPWAIPTASLVGVLCFVCFTIGIWPAYRWLSLPVTIALFFGAVFFIGLFPGGKKKEAPAMLQEEEQEAAELLADAQR